MTLKFADRKLCSELFCHWSHSFADPSHKLRASAQDSVWASYFVIPSLRSGQRL